MHFTMPPIRDPADLAAVVGALAGAAVHGSIAPGEAAQPSQLIETWCGLSKPPISTGACGKRHP